MAKTNETMWDKVKDTANNVAHANSNARKAKEAEKRARRNAVAGGVGILGIGIIAIVDRISWNKRYKKIMANKEKDKKRVDILQDQINNISECVDVIVEERRGTK